MPKRKRRQSKKANTKVTAIYNEPWGQILGGSDVETKAKGMFDLVLHHRDKLNEMAALRKEAFSKALRIKQAAAPDEPFLRQMLVIAANWRETKWDYEGSIKSAEETLANPRIARYIDGWGRTGDAGVIGYIDKQSVGAAWYRLFSAKDPGFGFVDRKTPEITIAVARGYRNAGVGTKLLRTLLTRANREGFLAISLSVEPDNRARKLYEKFDFKKVSQNDDAWTMVRNLV